MQSPKRVRAPNCTHEDVDRIYGRDQYCDVCGHPPSIGFLYQCRQDGSGGSFHHLSTGTVDRVPSGLRFELESMGLSESVILTAEHGGYTNAQLAKLKDLKLEQQQAIADTEQKQDILTAVARMRAGTANPTDHDGAGDSKQMHESIFPGCGFKCCHTCRPYFRDRVYTSFEAVLSGGLPSLTPSDLQHLPVKHAGIMQNIGNAVHTNRTILKHLPTPSTIIGSSSCGASSAALYSATESSSGSSDLTFKTTQTDIDDISAQRQPRRAFYGRGRRSSSELVVEVDRLSKMLTRGGLKNIVKNFFRSGREPSSANSNVTLPLPRTGTVRDLVESPSVREFDVGALRRVRRQKERIEVRDGTYTSGFEDVAHPRTTSNADAHTVLQDIHDTEPTDSLVSSYEFASEGGEVEVEGGVALTEEAVVEHTPDIVAIDMFPPTRDSDSDKENDMDAAVGFALQSLVTQA